MLTFRTLLLCSATTALYAQQPAPPQSHHQQPVVCAHRGWLSPSQVENSLPVMEKTAQAGVAMIEFDLRRSSDGRLYLLHDATLDRTTDAAGPVLSKSAAELRQVHLRGPETGRLVEAIPTFDQFLVWAQHHQIELMVDLKDAPSAQVVSELKRYGLLNRAILLTFDEATAQAALASDPQVRVSILTKTQSEVDQAIQTAGQHPIDLYLPRTGEPALFQYAHQRGQKIITDLMEGPDLQFAANGEDVYREYLKDRPVDILVSNHPEALRRTLSNPR
ncbi:glycerophosphoryl diester phosphodiesterase [Granulicella aggregans]|uniref:Glycerophosphoryl diester phosphodiesterase n=1 Tax=Granulicella aggregans TaxID=474949 RepID=A0A7W8E2B0_9BACT|nr:glycerophosphodiester phosphodiesterase family protein [Granulicella aggregans]MBB5055999.1 glycerophosphoryl diester phosphodiesterase [Granulicella aggregans]